MVDEGVLGSIHLLGELLDPPLQRRDLLLRGAQGCAVETGADAVAATVAEG